MEAAALPFLPFFMICCYAPDEVLRRRLEKRKQSGMDASDGRWELLESQKKSFDPSRWSPGSPSLPSTPRKIDEIADRALLRIRPGGDGHPLAGVTVSTDGAGFSPVPSFPAAEAMRRFVSSMR